MFFQKSFFMSVAIFCLFSMVFAQEYIYWTTNPPSSLNSQPSLMRTNLDGTNTITLIPNCTALGKANNETYIYWANQATYSIGRAKLDGSEVNPNFITGCINPIGIAINENHIFWTNTDPSSPSIGKANLDGTNVNQSFITISERPVGLAINSTHIFWCSITNIGVDGYIGRANLDGTNITEHYIYSGFSYSVAINSSHIFWAKTNILTGEASSIGRANLNGTDVNINFIPITSPPQLSVLYGMTISREHIFWCQQIVSPTDNFLGSDNVIDFFALQRNAGEGTARITIDIARAKLDGTDVTGGFITHPDGAVLPYVPTRYIPDDGDDSHNCGAIGFEFVLVFVALAMVRKLWR